MRVSRLARVCRLSEDAPGILKFEDFARRGISEFVWGPSSSLDDAGLEERDDRVSVPVLDLQLLGLLCTHSLSGYELRKNLKQSFGLHLSYGTLYPHLRSLEFSGFIFGRWENGKKIPRKKRVYSLTPYGKRMLKKNLDDLCLTTMKLQLLIENQNPFE